MHMPTCSRVFAPDLGGKTSCCYLLALLTLLLVTVGCQQNASTPGDVLEKVDPQLLVDRGQIRFINDAQTGLQLAEQQRLPCLLFFTAEWCTFCHQMEETAFVDATIGKLAKHFVCVFVDADREPQLCQHYGIRGYPTLQFLATDGRRLHRLVGRQTTQQLAGGMRAALQRLAWLDQFKPTIR